MKKINSKLSFFLAIFIFLGSFAALTQQIYANKDVKIFKSLLSQQNKFSNSINNEKKDILKKDIKSDYSLDSKFASISLKNKEKRNLSTETFADREKYSCEITLDPLANGKKEYFCNEEILLYSNLSLSGGSTTLEKGGYMLITLPCKIFKRPKEKDISKGFDKLISVGITGDEDFYYIKLKLDTILAGNSGALPFKVRFKENSLKNMDKHNISIGLYNTEGKVLDKNNFELISRALVPRIIDWTLRPVVLKKEPIGGIIQEQIEQFEVRQEIITDSNKIDIRRGKMVVTMPLGLVPTDSNWVKIGENKYEKIFDNINTPPFVSANIGGLKYSKDLTFEVVYTKYIEKLDGSGWEEINTAKFKNNVKLPPKPVDPTESKAEVYIDYEYIPRLLDKNLNVIREGDRLSLPFTKEDIGSLYVAESYKPERYVILKRKDEKDPIKFVIKEIWYNVPKSLYPKSIRLINATSTPMPPDIRVVGEVGNEIDELTNNCMVINADDMHTGKKSAKWQDIPEKPYTALRITFPGEGVIFEGKENFEKFINGFAFERLSKIGPEVYEDFQKKIEKGDSPRESYYPRKGLRCEANTEVTYSQRKNEIVTAVPSGNQAFPNITFDANYLKIKKGILSVKIKNSGDSDWGSNGANNFYAGNEIGLSSDFYLERVGDVENVETRNLTLNYLIPIGIEPLREQKDFSEIKIKPSNLKGYQLIIAKPRKITYPELTKYSNFVSNSYTIGFEVKPWCEQGIHKCYHAVLIDNNIPVYNKGRTRGYIMEGKAEKPFIGIHKNGENHPIDSSALTQFESKEISISPPQQLIGLTKVKLSEENDDSYGHSTGRKITKSTREASVDFRQEFKNDSLSDISKMTFLNILPRKGDLAPSPNKDGKYSPRGSSFELPLIKPVSNDLFDLYYSTELPGKTIEENMIKTFVKKPNDYSKVTMIKGVLKPNAIIEKGKKAYVVTRHKLQAEKLNPKEYAANSMAFIISDRLEEQGLVEGYEARVNVFSPIRDVKIKKIDENTSEPLQDVGFTLYKKGEDKPFLGELFTDKNGIINFPNLEVDQTYVLKESTVLREYMKLKDIEFTVKEYKVIIDNEERDFILIKNRKKIMPQTGGMGTISFVTLGIVIMAGSVCYKKEKLEKLKNCRHT